MKFYRFLIVVALGLLLGACAFGDRDVYLTYPPEENDGGSISAMAAELETKAEMGQRQTLVISLFEDLRPDKATVGEVRNGWGMKTADANTSSDVPAWVREAARYEFERAGFNVLFSDEIDQTYPVLDGQIITVFCKAFFSYEGEVSLIAKLSLNGKTVMDQRYTGEGSVGMNWAATGKSYGQSLTLALQDVMRGLVIDVHQAIRRAQIAGSPSQ